MAQRFFEITNTIALVAWIALVAAPHVRIVSRVACAVVIPGILAAMYAAVLGWKLASGPRPGDLGTIAGLRAAFADDWVFAAAWTHYLVFDMVVGAWIARDAVRLGVPWPIRTVALALTFLAGPVGFLMHLVARGSRLGRSRGLAAVVDAEPTAETAAPPVAPVAAADRAP